MLMLVNGDYVPQGNGLRSAKRDEAVLQRMLMKLTARRGQFPFMENFGQQTVDFGPAASCGMAGCGGTVCTGGPPG
mgnify:CR=1 FL=1